MKFINFCITNSVLNKMFNSSEEIFDTVKIYLYIISSSVINIHAILKSILLGF